MRVRVVKGRVVKGRVVKGRVVEGRVVEDRGQAVPLVLAMVAVVALMTVAGARFGARVLAEEQAQVVADAAALAGVDGGRNAADRLARANGGVVTAFDVIGDEVVVSVRHGEATATARASRAP